jgi:hypothetical protein
MSEGVLNAVLGLRAFLFEAVYENSIATLEFKKASGILSGLWEKVANGRTTSSIGRRSTLKVWMPRRAIYRRNDRQVRGQAVRAALHPEALGDRLGRIGSLGNL